MIKSSTGEVCSPNDDIKALDLHGTNALRAKLLQIQADSGTGEEALLAEAEIAVGVEQAAEQEKQAAQAEQEKQAEKAAKKALSDFRSYLAQSTGKAAQALPEDSELEYPYNPVTQQCEITRLDGAPILLDISNSGLSGELPLPPQLMVAGLYCRLNQLTSLPEVLPASLTRLECYDNQLTTLPEQLPPSLTELHCSDNRLTSLPEVLPASLTKLYCFNNQLTSLPELPTSLTGLWCNNNLLAKLPELPTRLINLDCSDNPDLASNPAAQAALQELRARGVWVRS